MSNTTKLLTALIEPVVAVEAAIQQLLIGRAIDTATGLQLDIIGKIVLQPRGGLEDDLYRRYIRARISVHRSKGTISDVLKVATCVLHPESGGIWVRTVKNASFILEIHDLPVDSDVAEALFKMLRQTVSAGVRVILGTSDVSLDETFRLDDGPGLDVGHLAAGVDNV